MGKNHIYIAQCSDGTYYTGYAVDVDARIDVHNSGKGAKYTRARRPVTLKYTESVSYTHLTLPTIHVECRSRWSPYH